MNFKIAKKEFLDAITISNRAISTTTPLPCLCGIKIVLTSDCLTLISSDSNISIKTTIHNDDLSTLVINDEGEVVIEAKYLIEIVRKIDSEFINFEIIDGTLIKIYGGSSEFKINGMNVNDYPEINFDINNDSPFTIDSNLFNQIINETSFACSDKETRPVLTGVNFRAQDKKLYINATDSFRLASKTIDIDSDLNFDITVPNKYLSEICHSITNEKELTISINNQKISFIFGNTIIDTRLLDDQFPDTTRLIPSTFSQKLTVNSRELISAIDRASFIKSDGKNIIKMKINNEKIELTAANQIGSSFETIDVINYEGEPLEISCSGKYLIEAVKALSCENVTINFSGELKPMIVVDENNNSLVQLISPVRTYR